MSAENPHLGDLLNAVQALRSDGDRDVCCFMHWVPESDHPSNLEHPSNLDTVSGCYPGNLDTVSGCCLGNLAGQCAFKTASSTDLAYRKSSSLVSKYVVCE